MRQKLKLKNYLAALFAALAILAFSAVAFAAPDPTGGTAGGGSSSTNASNKDVRCPAGYVKAKSGNQACVPDKNAIGNDCTNKTDQQCLTSNPLIKDLNSWVNVLSALVGVVVVGSLVYAGIQYSLAGDNAQATGAAKGRITKTLVALVAYISISAFLQWLIPGGLFG